MDSLFVFIVFAILSNGNLRQKNTYSKTLRFYNNEPRRLNELSKGTSQRQIFLISREQSSILRLFTILLYMSQSELCEDLKLNVKMPFAFANVLFRQHSILSL